MEFVNCPTSFYSENYQKNELSEEEIRKRDMTVENIKKDFLWYENVDKSGQTVYPHIRALLESNQELYHEKNAIIFFVNSDTGFGSQMMMFVQYLYFVQKRINAKLHCLPYFGQNILNFQYHEESLYNSFFLYFRYFPEIQPDAKIYFVNIDTPLINFYDDHESRCPFFHYDISEDDYVNNHAMNWDYSTHFKSKFSLKIGGHIINYIDSVRDVNRKLIGVHVRALANVIYSGGEHGVTIQSNLLKLRDKLNKKYGDAYDIFLATDVNSYIQMVETIFVGHNVYYIKEITRMEYDQTIEDDKILLLDSSIMLQNYKGFKLGSEILYDVLALTLCDEFYLRKTNVAFMTGFIGNNNNGKRYI